MAVEISKFIKEINPDVAFANSQFAWKEVDGARIGRVILPIELPASFAQDEKVLSLANLLNGYSQNSTLLRSQIQFSLNNNIESKSYPSIAHERGVSACFTHDPESQTIVIEWGAINAKNREAKLHHYLNKNINFANRLKQGMKISSGHLAKLCETKNIHIALFDNLSSPLPKQKITKELKETIDTLYAHSIIPITGDGYVQLPLG